MPILQWAHSQARRVNNNVNGKQCFGIDRVNGVCGGVVDRAVV